MSTEEAAAGETDHTPGPWKATLKSDGGFVISATGGHCKSPAYVVCNRNCHTRSAETHSNARLIAASPDLKDALKALYEWALTNCDETRLLMQSEAALTKAEGKAL